MFFLFNDNEHYTIKHFIMDEHFEDNFVKLDCVKSNQI